MSLDKRFEKLKGDLLEQLDTTSLLPSDIDDINNMMDEIEADKTKMKNELQALLDTDESNNKKQKEQERIEIDKTRFGNTRFSSHHFQGKGGTRRKKRGKKSRRMKRKSRR